MASNNKNKPKTPEKKGVFSKATPEKIGAAAVGLAVFSTMAPGLALGTATLGGTVLVINKYKKNKKAKKNKK